MVVSLTKSKDVASISDNSRDDELLGGHVKAVADYQHSDRLAILFGGEVMRRNQDQTLSDQTGSLERAFGETLGASFVEAEVFASSALAFKGGLRMEHNSLTGKSNLTPRLSSAYKTGTNSQVSLAYGQFYQAPQNQIILADQDANPEKAEHYIANYQWVKDGQSFRIEAYEKRYDGLTRYTNSFDPTTYQFNGDGHARGLDLFWRDNKTFKSMDYWVSYSYLQTEREYRDFPGSFTPAFASEHNFSFVMKKFISDIKSQIGVTYSFASGRPYNDPNMEQYLGGKTPAYHDLSFNVSYLYSNQVIVHAMVNNVLGINNIFGYEFADQPNADGVFASRAITPPAPRFIFLGVFITLSKNTGINQLPNL